MSKTPKMVSTAPDSIYLIVDPNGYSCVMSDKFPRDTGEVSWCEDSCGGIEVKYVRDDLSQNTQSGAAAHQAKDRVEQKDARIAKLTARNAELEAEVARYKADAERLDWCEANPDHGSMPYYEDGKFNVTWLSRRAEGVCTSQFNTLREAIDFAHNELKESGL